MTLRRRFAFVVAAGLAAGTLAHFADPSGSTGALVFLAAGLVLGELLVLRLENGTAVPLSYAVLLVLASTFPAPRYAGAVAGAELISALLRFSDRESGWRVQVMVERLVVAAGTIAVYDGLRALTNHDETVAAVLLTLGAAAASQLPLDLAARWVLRLQPTFSGRTRLGVARDRVVGDADGDRIPRGRRSRPGRHLGTVAVLHPVAGGVVRVRAARLRDPRV